MTRGTGCEAICVMEGTVVAVAVVVSLGKGLEVGIATTLVVLAFPSGYTQVFQ